MWLGCDSGHGFQSHCSVRIWTCLSPLCFLLPFPSLSPISPFHFVSRPHVWVVLPSMWQLGSSTWPFSRLTISASRSHALYVCCDAYGPIFQMDTDTCQGQMLLAGWQLDLMWFGLGWRAKNPSEARIFCETSQREGLESNLALPDLNMVWVCVWKVCLFFIEWDSTCGDLDVYWANWISIFDLVQYCLSWYQYVIICDDDYIDWKLRVRVFEWV